MVSVSVSFLTLVFIMFMVTLYKFWSEPSSNPLPPFWNQLSLTPPPMIHLNPWLVRDRMQAYKWLAEATNNAWPSDPNSNIHLGYALQLKWQWDSGRLNAVKENPIISDKSWFGGVNYYLSILPFVGAWEAGLFGNDTTLDLNTTLGCVSSNYCCWNEQTGTLVEEWRDYFKLYLNATFDRDPLLNLQRRLWKVHSNSLDAAVRNFEHLKPHFPLIEWIFGNGWAYFTKILDRVNFPTDLHTVSSFQKLLPPRVLDWFTEPLKLDLRSLPTVLTCISSYFVFPPPTTVPSLGDCPIIKLDYKKLLTQQSE